MKTFNCRDGSRGTIRKAEKLVDDCSKPGARGDESHQGTGFSKQVNGPGHVKCRKTGEKRKTPQSEVRVVRSRSVPGSREPRPDHLRHLI